MKSYFFTDLKQKNVDDLDSIVSEGTGQTSTFLNYFFKGH